MTETVVCATCSRAYGRRAGEAPLLASEASMAALLTGWERTEDGRWWCGTAYCRPEREGNLTEGERAAVERVTRARERMAS